jgi:ATP-binding cassette, subfamily B, bacterial
MSLKRLAGNLEIKQYLSTKEMKKIFFLLMPYILKHKKAYIGLFLLMFVDIALTLGFAWFMGDITNAAVRSDFNRIKWLLLVGVSMALFSITINFIDTYLETIAVNAVKKDLNLDLYKHILLLQGKSLSNLHSGELVSHFTNDIHNIDAVIGRGLLNLIRLPVLFIAAFTYLVNISWKLSFLSLLVAPIAIVGGAVFGILLRNNSRVIHSLISTINKSLNDTFQGFTVIKSFTLEKILFKEYKSKNDELYSLELKDAKLRGAFYAGGEAIGSVTFLTSLVLGAFFVSEKVITIGALLSFVNLVNHLVYPLTGLAGQWAGYQRSISALERITHILDQPSDAKNLPFYSRPRPVNNFIRFENITFGYEEQKRVFDQFHMQVPIGKVVAIVGPSGAGKSTLFNLLLGFYKPESGDILLDDQSINDLPISEWRNAIAYVPQETFLFSGTIRENLLVVRPDITEKEMIEASINANIHDFIESLPGGYDTEIGERGIRLSGGQRQRIAIARAILKDAPILLLDEATSALDNGTEYLVKEALNKLMQNRTTVVIAHRLSTVEHADLLFVMDEGRIVQKGTYHDLVKEQGLFRQLNETQYFEEMKNIKSFAANA